MKYRSKCTWGIFFYLKLVTLEMCYTVHLYNYILQVILVWAIVQVLKILCFKWVQSPIFEMEFSLSNEDFLQPRLGGWVGWSILPHVKRLWSIPCQGA